MIRFLFLLLAMLQGTARPAVVTDARAIAHVPFDRLRPGEDFVVEATVSGPRPIVRVSLSFQVGDRFGDVALERTGPSAWHARVPAARLGRDFAYIIHASDE